MKPGDLVKFKEGKGFTWWADALFVYLRPVEGGWIQLLRGDGVVTEGNGEHFEVVS